MRKKKTNSNLNFIANYLFANPYSSSTEIRRALCTHLDKAYTRGHYTEYFREETTSQWNCSTLPRSIAPSGRRGRWKKGYGKVLWKRTYINGKPKWSLTMEGMSYVTLHKEESKKGC